MSRCLMLLLCVLAGDALITQGAAAREGRAYRTGAAKEASSLISHEQAAAIARSATGGRVLNVRLDPGQPPRYRVRLLLDERRVRNIGIDARSGAILK